MSFYRAAMWKCARASAREARWSFAMAIYEAVSTCGAPPQSLVPVPRLPTQGGTHETVRDSRPRHVACGRRAELRQEEGGRGPEAETGSGPRPGIRVRGRNVDVLRHDQPAQGHGRRGAE